MRTISPLCLLALVLTAVGIGCARPAVAINIRIDYSTDTKGFFGTGNPQGATAGGQAKAALEAAAEFYSGILEDTFSVIDVPTKTYGSKGGEATYFWKRRFMNPETGFNIAEVNPEKTDENEYVIFVGARDLLGDEAGRGGFGGIAPGKVIKNGSFTPQENADIAAIVAQFESESTKRGEASGFGKWGGSLAFDSPRTWHFDHTTSPGVGTSDFYSLALHELGHALGLGTSDEWNQLVSTNTATNISTFNGTNSVSTYGNADLRLESVDDTGHWSQGTNTSPVYEGSGMQTPLMVPEINSGLRRLLTNLDAAALADIGWEIDLPGASAASASFVSSSFSSGSTSLAALSLSVVPEPTTALLASLAASLLLLKRSRRVV